MAFDAYFLTAVLDKLRREATGARVEKIHQPARDSVILLLRTEKGRQKLLLAANPAAPRLHLTTATPENPAEPPMFCMLLRKHLMGAKLAEVTQIPMERCAMFTFDCIDEMGDHVEKQLIAADPIMAKFGVLLGQYQKQFSAMVDMVRGADDPEKRTKMLDVLTRVQASFTALLSEE